MSGSSLSPFTSASHPLPLADYPAQFKSASPTCWAGKRCPGIKCVMMMELSMTESGFYILCPRYLLSSMKRAEGPQLLLPTNATWFLPTHIHTLCWSCPKSLPKVRALEDGVTVPVGHVSIPEHPLNYSHPCSLQHLLLLTEELGNGQTKTSTHDVAPKGTGAFFLRKD